MEMNLAQFLAEASAAECPMSASAGIVTFESGDTFAVGSNVEALQDLLREVWMDLEDASNLLADFSNTQEGDTPHYQASLDKLQAFRKSLEPSSVNVEQAMGREL